MTRWLVAFDNGPIEAATAMKAVESCERQLGLEFGHEVFAVDLDALEGTDRLVLFRIGAVEIEWSSRDTRRSSFGAPLDLAGIDWLILGGESGPGARPFRLEHARELIDACFRAGAGRPAIFVKQLGRDPVDRNPLGGDVRLDLADAKGGDPDEWPPDLRIREFPDAAGEAAAA